MQSTEIDRSQVSRELAKALAYAQCGKQAEAEAWAARLVRTLGCYGILRDELASLPRAGGGA